MEEKKGGENDPMIISDNDSIHVEDEPIWLVVKKEPTDEGNE